MGEEGEGDADGGFELGAAEGGFVEGDVDFVAGVGRVVAGDAVDGAVVEALHQEVKVELGSEGGQDFEPSVELADAFVREGEVGGADFAGDGRAEELGLADHFDRAPGADAHDVQLAAGVQREEAVAHDGDLFGAAGDALEAEHRADRAFVHRAALAQGGVFAMGEDGEVELDAEFHGLAHDEGTLDGEFFVTGGHDPGLLHGGEVGKFEAVHASGEGTDGGHEDAAGFGRGGFIEDEIDEGRVVQRGVGVGHAADRGVAPGGGGLGAGRDGFLVGRAGLAEVDVGVDEAGRDPESRAVVDFVEVVV